jgi:hypothetical protein
LNETSDNTRRLPLLVIDKSFAHAKGKHLAALSTKYCFLVPSAFYYEVFDPESATRLETLAGFSEFRRVNLPTLLQGEIESSGPAREANLPLLRVNPKVRSLDWRLSPDEATTIQRYKGERVEPLVDFWNSVIDHGVIGFSRVELEAARATPEEFVTLCKSLCDRDRIRMIAAEIGFPHAAILDESWLHYRKFQTLILQGLILWRRYRNPGDTRSARRMEHDTHDIEYLMLGLHVGNLATCDTNETLTKASMGWRFRLLRSQGQLLTLESV